MILPTHDFSFNGGMLIYTRFTAATCILNKNQKSRSFPSAYSPSTFAKPFKTPKTVHPPRPGGGYIPNSEPDAGPSRTSSPAPTSMPERSSSSFVGKTVAQTSFYAPAKVKKDKIVIGEKSNVQRHQWGGALHDPNAEGAVVMPRPPANGRLAKELQKRCAHLVSFESQLTCLQRDRGQRRCDRPIYRQQTALTSKRRRKGVSIKFGGKASDRVLIFSSCTPASWVIQRPKRKAVSWRMRWV